MKIVKRDGHIVEYNPDKIRIAIDKANKEMHSSEQASAKDIESIIKYIEKLDKKRLLVEDIQDIIEVKLMEKGKYSLAKKYITYRYTRELVRKANTTDYTIKELIDNDIVSTTKEDVQFKNIVLQRNSFSSITSADITKRFLLPDDIRDAVDDGKIIFHDLDYFAANAIINASIIDVGEMLDSGSVINGIKLNAPNDFMSACLNTASILHEVSSNQYGMCYIYLDYLVKYMSDDDISIGLERLILSLNTETTINGYPPKVGILIDESRCSDSGKYKMLIKTLLSVKNNQFKNSNGEKTVPTYPKIVCVTGEDEELKKLVIESGVDTFISGKITKPLVPSFDQGIVSINLIDIKLNNDTDEEFMNNLDEITELAHRALQIKHKRLSRAISDASPILFKYGAISKLNSFEPIHDLLHKENSTISLSLVGLNLLSKELKDKTIEYLKNKCKEWSNLENLKYKLICYNDIKENEMILDKMVEKHGLIKGITDISKNDASICYFDETSLTNYGILEYVKLKDKSIDDFIKEVHDNGLMVKIMKEDET